MFVVGNVLAGTKRAAADSGVNTRANKVAKTGKGAAPKTAAAKRGGKRGPKVCRHVSFHFLTSN